MYLDYKTNVYLIIYIEDNEITHLVKNDTFDKKLEQSVTPNGNPH